MSSNFGADLNILESALYYDKREERYLSLCECLASSVLFDDDVIDHVSGHMHSIGTMTLDFPLVPSLVPRPALTSTKREKGLVTIERYLGCAESAILLLGNIPRDIYCNATCVPDLITANECTKNTAKFLLYQDKYCHQRCSTESRIQRNTQGSM